MSMLRISPFKFMALLLVLIFSLEQAALAASQPISTISLTRQYRGELMTQLGSRMAEEPVMDFHGFKNKKQEGLFLKWLAKRQFPIDTFEKLSAFQKEAVTKYYEKFNLNKKMNILILAIFAGILSMPLLAENNAEPLIGLSFFMLSTVLHEIGHWLVAKYLFMQGALKSARIHLLDGVQPRVSAIPSDDYSITLRQKIAFTLGGPLANLASGILGLGITLLMTEDSFLRQQVAFFGNINLTLFVLNLLPISSSVFPSDGYQIRSYIQKIALVQKLKTIDPIFKEASSKLLVNVMLNPLRIKTQNRVFVITPENKRNSPDASYETFDKNGETAYKIKYPTNFGSEISVPEFQIIDRASYSFPFGKENYVVFEIQPDGARLAKQNTSMAVLDEHGNVTIRHMDQDSKIKFMRSSIHSKQPLNINIPSPHPMLLSPFTSRKIASLAV